MKYSKLIYATGAGLVIASSLMKILHLPYANTILVFALMTMIVLQSYHIRMLERRIKEMKSPAQSNNCETSLGL